MVKNSYSFNPAVGIDNDGFQIQETNTTTQDHFQNTNQNGTSTVKIGQVSNNGEAHTAQKRKKSLIQLTREVLPRLDYYRNSQRGMKRPSLGELHGADGSSKEKSGGNNDAEEFSTPGHGGIKLGWIQGVLIPCMLNIFGVMLFLRLSWVVAEAGTGLSLIIIAISAVVCVITTLSLSAISTNGEVKGGGIYYIISRSLGPEFGASVGVVFAFANAVSASMNTIGFCNSLSDLLHSYGITFIDRGINDARVIGTPTIILMIFICAVGMEWESKAQNFLIAAIVAAMVDFMVGTAIGPTTDHQKAMGFTGFNATVFETNWGPDYRRQDGQDYDFFAVFSIFFPSVTGLQAGANISGDLKDPATAIPKGTLLSLLITMVSYAVFVVFAGAAAIRDASGKVTDYTVYNNYTDCAANKTCQFGLYNSYEMMTIMSSWEPLIYAGCFAACLSTALTNLLSVPRLIQALGIDQIYPGLIYFSKGYGKAGEPYRGYVLTFLLSEAFLLIGNLNALAPLISNFYLASYALINFCTFHADLIKPLGWRPTFRYYNKWLSLAGFIMCVVIMFLINWITSLITFIVLMGLYLVVVYRKPDVNWGSSTQAQTYKAALATTQRLLNVGEHVKNYKPQVLVLSGCPKIRPPLIDFANLITKNHSLLIVGDVVEQHMSHKQKATKTNNVYAYLKSNKIKAFYTIIDNISFETGAKALLQTCGIGKLRPNVLLMGYKNDWRTCSSTDLLEYFNVLHSAFDQHLSVAILRVKDGLDFSKFLSDDDNNHATENSVTLRTSASIAIMHADSNLSLPNVGLKNENGSSKKGSPKDQHKATAEMKKKKSKLPLDTVLNMSSDDLSRIEDMSIFRKKQKKGFIDVWWLYDDGGLTMLLPYIISTRQDWSGCSLRVFALTSNKNELELEERNMANLLSKFRLEYKSLKMVSISDRPQDSTIAVFDNLISDFKTEGKSDCQITESELIAFQEKTYRQLRLRELLIEHSSDSNLIVMSLPLPRKGTISSALYMAWLEVLTKDLPPYLLVRGNQQSVLTFYS